MTSRNSSERCAASVMYSNAGEKPPKLNGVASSVLGCRLSDMLVTLRKQSVGGAPMAIQPSSIRDPIRKPVDPRMA
jgi:hypothetical protein